MNKYKQVVVLPDRVSQSVFDLPCIVSITKYANGDGFFYELTKVERVAFADPGEILAEDNEGHWWKLSQEDYEEWKEQNNVITLKRIWYE